MRRFLSCSDDVCVFAAEQPGQSGPGLQRSGSVRVRGEQEVPPAAGAGPERTTQTDRGETDDQPISFTSSNAH